MSEEHALNLWKRYNVNILSKPLCNKYFFVEYDDILEDNHIMNQFSRFIKGKEDVKCSESFYNINLRHSNPSQLDVIKRDTATNELYMILKDIVMLNDSDWKKKEYLFDNTRYNKFKINKTISFNSNKFLTFKEFLIIDDFKIVIYGAGNYGKKTSEFLDNVKISDYIFVDQNYKKVNSIFCGKKIYAVNKLLEIDKKYMKYIVIVSINDDEEVLEVYKKLLWLNNCKIMSYRDLILYNKISKE